MVGGDVLSLNELLANDGTLAFIVERGGRIIYEQYAPGYDRYRPVTSFSIAKSVSSLLLAAAIESGIIAGYDTPVSAILPEVLASSPAYERVTLGNLISMRSGIRYRDHDLPWGDKPLSYYHPELRRVATTLPVTSEPGEDFVYNTWNTVLLGVALERASGESIADLTSGLLWRPLGAEREASWSLDSERDSLAKMESGFNAAPVDFLRLGRLMLEDGRACEEQVVPARYVTTVLQPNPELAISSTLHYQNGWWLHVDPQEESPEAWAVAGWGHLGQFLYAFPREDVVIVRFGRHDGRPSHFEAWGDLLRQVAVATAAQQ